MPAYISVGEAFKIWECKLAERNVPNPYFEPFREALQELALWKKIIPVHGESQKVAWAMPKRELLSMDMGMQAHGENEGMQSLGFVAGWECKVGLAPVIES